MMSRGSGSSAGQGVQDNMAVLLAHAVPGIGEVCVEIIEHFPEQPTVQPVQHSHILKDPTRYSLGVPTELFDPSYQHEVECALELFGEARQFVFGLCASKDLVCYAVEDLTVLRVTQDGDDIGTESEFGIDGSYHDRLLPLR
jgi:hypothetical protein